MNQKLSNKVLWVLFIVFVIMAFSSYSYQPPCIPAYNAPSTVDANGTIIVDATACQPTIPGINDQIVLLAKIATILFTISAICTLIWIIKRRKLNTFYSQNTVQSGMKPTLIGIVVIGLFILSGYFIWGRNSVSTLSSDPAVDAVLSRMPNDPKLRADYVIDHDVISMLVQSGPYSTDHHLDLTGFCSSATALPLIAEIAKLNVGGQNGVRCTDGPKGMAISSSLNNGSYVCTDTTGYYSNNETALHSGSVCSATTTKTTI
jgi:hypothetical protein